MAEDVSVARFRVAESGSTTWIAVEGELDARGAQQLRELLLGTIGGGGVGSVVVNCAGVTFVDSTGLGALVHATKRAIAKDVRLVIEAPSDRLQTLLRVTGLDKVLTVVAAEG